MSASTWGGSEDLWAAMALLGVTQGHRVAAYLRRPEAPHPKIEWLRKGGVGVQFCPPFAPAPLSVESLTLRAKRLAGRNPSPFDDLIRWRPHAVFINEGGFYSQADVTDCAAILHASGIPYVVACCSTDGLPPPEEASVVIAEFYERAQAVLFNTEATLKAVQRQLARPLLNSSVARDPLDPAEWIRAPWPSGGVAFASVASLDVRWKGQDILLEILSAPEWRVREWRLSIFGEGRDRAYLGRLIEYFDLTDRVQLCGHCDDIRAVWMTHHALVLPSRQESAPKAMIEAMLCGRPVIATDADGISDWVQDGASGFIAEGATVRSYGRALERAWAAKENWSRMGERAHTDACALLKGDGAAGLLDMLTHAKSGNG